MKQANDDKSPKRLAVIRVRGRVNVRGKIEDTLKMLRLNKVNHCVFVNESPSLEGMISKVKDYVTWGEVDEKDVTLVLKNRGELSGGGKLTDAYIKENTEFKSIENFAEAFIASKAELRDIPHLKPVFRLHPPRKGHKKIKRPFVEGGALGYRGPKIKDLVYRMR
ncbi:MAG: 50S ribosomal protein L30 [Candidatus Hydrothermarchaeales archaeon]